MLPNEKNIRGGGGRTCNRVPVFQHVYVYIYLTNSLLISLQTIQDISFNCLCICVQMQSESRSTATPRISSFHVIKRFRLQNFKL